MTKRPSSREVGISQPELRAKCHQLAVEHPGPSTHVKAAVGRADERLRVALEQLRNVLQAMPPSIRQDRLASLDAVVRTALLGFMEGRSVVHPAKLAQKEKSEDMLASDGSSQRKAKAGNRRVVLPGSGLTGVHRGQRGLYRAKTSIDGIILYSRYASLDRAALYQSTLIQFRHNVAARLRLLAGEETALAMGENCPEKVFMHPMPPRLLRGAFLAALADGSVKVAFAEAGVRMYLSLHVAKWLGSVHVTSPVVSAVEVLSLRERLLSARMLGWEAFRQAWIELLQIQAKHRRGRWGASAEAEAHVESIFLRNTAIGAHKKFDKSKSAPPRMRLAAIKSSSAGKAVVACRSGLRLRRLERRFGKSVNVIQRILVWMRKATKRRR